jgi:hypothetical protein
MNAVEADVEQNLDNHLIGNQGKYFNELSGS